MAGSATTFRSLEYPLQADAPQGRQWRAGPSVFGAAAIEIDCSEQSSTIDRQYHREGASRRDGCAKNGAQAIGKSRGGWTTKIHVVGADDRNAVGFSLSGGEAGDAPQGRELLQQIDLQDEARNLVMDKAYEGDETRQLSTDLGLKPVVLPKSNRVVRWDYDRGLYKLRNEIERLFRRLKRFRQVSTPYDKLDVVFTFFIYFALIADALKSI